MGIFTKPGDPGYHTEAIYTQSDFDRFTAMQRHFEKELREAQIAIRCLVVASGGEIKVPERLLVDCPEQLEVYTESYSRDRVFRASKELDTLLEVHKRL